MSKEGESALQFELFAGQSLKPTSLEPSEATPTATIDEGFKEYSDFPPPTDQNAITERQAPMPTLREVRAVSSLLRNRLQLEVVERRIQKTSAIIVSYLLTQDSLSAQIGSYFVWLNEEKNIEALRTLSDDDWQQLYFPEIEPESIKDD
jgi:hypothetical protein